MKISICLLPAVLASQDQRKRQRLGEPATSFSDEPTSIDSSGWGFPIQVATGYRIIGISSRGRFTESHDLIQVEKTYDNTTARIVEEQFSFDRRYDLFTPNTQADSMVEITPYGEVELGNVYSASPKSITFELPSVPDALIKYTTNCFDIMHNRATGDTVVHPLVIDHHFSNEAHSRALSKQSLFLSPPAPLCKERIGRCYFEGLSDSAFKKCRIQGGTVRYMLVPKTASLTLNELRSVYNGSIPFPIAMELGFTLINVLRDLHMNARILHGDIGARNVVLEPQNGREFMKLINFGRRVMTTSHALQTVWEMDGYLSAARDDVMRAIQMVARLVYPEHEYMQIEKYHEEEGFEDLREFKSSANFFAPPVPWFPGHHLDIVETLNVSTKTEIRSHLAHILELVRGLNSTITAIPYTDISAAFQACAILSSS